jgi:hypothetical protein
MAIQSQIVGAKATSAAIIAPCRLPMRHKINFSKPFLYHRNLSSISRDSIKRRKTSKLASSASQNQSSPSVDDDSTAADSARSNSGIESFKWEEASVHGQLVIAPLQSHEVGAASVVLTRAFATSPQGVPIEDGR